MDKYHQLLKPVNIISLVHCFSPSYDADFYFDGERHDFWECVYVVEGKIGVAEDEKIYELVAGDIVFHKPMEFHRLWSADNTRPKLIITSFTANGFGMDSLAEGVFSLNKATSKMMVETSEIAINNIMREPCWKKDYVSQQLLSNILEKMMLHILRDSTASISENNSSAAQNYKNIISAMNENINRPLNINELAEITNLSAPNLKKCFKKYSGMGVMRYFNRLKLMRARNLIAEGYQMSEISDMLGFSCQNYFSTAFKREYGFSPLEYKKLLKK